MVEFENKLSEVSGKYVTKRNGEKQPMSKEKLLARLKELTEGLNKEYINLDIVVEKVFIGSYPGK
jgi:hypothetical protein